MNFYNKKIKELCRLAKINTMVLAKKRIKDTVYERHFKKWYLVSSHTARRTFCLFLVNSGIDRNIAMQFSGHKDYKSFDRYINHSKEEAINQVNKAFANIYNPYQKAIDIMIGKR